MTASSVRYLCLACLWLLAVAGIGAAGDPATRVTDLISKLDKVDSRLQAVQDLAEVGPAAAPAVPGLIKLLQVKDEELRIHTVLALGRIGKKAVPPLAQAVASKDEEVRFYAAWGLGLIGAEAGEASPVLIAALGDSHGPVRRKAAFALGRLGPKAAVAFKVAEPLVKALEDSDEAVREQVTDALIRLGEPAVHALIGAIKAGPVRTRAQAIAILGAIGSDARAAIPALRSQLLGKELDTAAITANALASIGKEAIPTLADGIKDEREPIQQVSFTALAQLGSLAGPILADALSDKRPEVRRLAARTLGGMKLRDKTVVVALGAALDDEDGEVKSLAVLALQGLGANARPAAHYLQKALTDSNQDVRLVAFGVLRTIGDDFRPALRMGLAGKDVAVRIDLAGQILGAKLQVDEALPILLAALKEKDGAVRLKSVSALYAAQPNASEKISAKKVVLALAAVLEDESQTVREVAVEILFHVGANARPAAPQLKQALLGPFPAVRRSAFLTLRNLGDDFPATVRAGLSSKNAAVRIHVADLMVGNGEQVDIAVPVLVAALRDKDLALRVQAARALGDREQTKTIPVLIDGLRDGPEGPIGSEAYQALTTLGPKAGAAAPTMVKFLDRRHVQFRDLALAGLAKIGGDSAIVVPALVKVLDHEEGFLVRREAVKILALHGDRAIPVLLELLKDNPKDWNKAIRVQALDSLAQLRGDLKGALPLLAPVMRSKDTEARRKVIETIIGLDKQGLPLMVDALKDDFGEVVTLASHGIRSIGLDPAKTTPALLDLALTDPYAGSRHYAVQSLVGQGDDGVKSLLDALKNEKDVAFRGQAISAMFAAGPAGRTVAASALKIDDSKLRGVILSNMKKEGDRAKDAVPGLVACLKDSAAEVRSLAADVLGAVGADASDARDPLTTLLEDTDPAVRGSARNALKRIGSSGKER